MNELINNMLLCSEGFSNSHKLYDKIKLWNVFW